MQAGTNMLLTDLLLHIKGAVPKQDCDSFINFCEKRKITTEYERSLNSLSGQFEKSNYYRNYWARWGLLSRVFIK